MRRGIDPHHVEWDPVPEGTIRTRTRVSESGTRYEVALRWVGGGWTQVVGLQVGSWTLGLPARPGERAGGDGHGDDDIGTGIDGATLPPLDAKDLAQITADIEHWRANYETTQRLAMVWRDVESGALDRGGALTALGGREFKMLSNPRGVPHDVALAASLYRFFGDLGSQRQTEDVAQATQVSRATAARRISKARTAGLLGEARRGQAGERRSQT